MSKSKKPFELGADVIAALKEIISINDKAPESDKRSEVDNEHRD